MYRRARAHTPRRGAAGGSAGDWARIHHPCFRWCAAGISFAARQFLEV